MDIINDKILTASLSVIGALLTTFINSRIQPKAKFQYSLKHAFSFFVPGEQGGLIVHTRSVIIINSGKSLAKEIEVVFTHPPSHCKIWPPCDYETGQNSENFFIVKVKRLQRKSNMSIEILHVNFDAPNVVTVTHDSGAAENVGLNIQPMHKKERYSQSVS